MLSHQRWIRYGKPIQNQRKVSPLDLNQTTCADFSNAVGKADFQTSDALKSGLLPPTEIPNRLVQKSATIVEKASAASRGLTLPKTVIFCPYQQGGRQGRQAPSPPTYARGQAREESKVRLAATRFRPWLRLCPHHRKQDLQGRIWKGCEFTRQGIAGIVLTIFN